MFKSYTRDDVFSRYGSMMDDEEEFEVVEVPTGADDDTCFSKRVSDRAEVDHLKSKARTEVLAHEAEDNMHELMALIGKTKTGTTTRAEKDRLLSLNAKLTALKHDIKISKTIEKENELKLLRSKAKSKVADIKLAMKEKDIRRALGAIEFAESVDIAFVIDCTSSMSPYISSVKESIQGIVNRIHATNSHMNIRLAIVAYRDLCDGSNRFEVLDFVDSIDTFKAFLSGLSALGGGDAPEDLAGGVQKANELSWLNPTKTVFIIADAPCHGSALNGMATGDSYPGGTPGIDMIEELHLLEKKSGQGTLTITFGRITNQTDVMINNFASSGVTVDQVSIEEASKLTKTVTASVRKSIFKTVTTKGRPGASVAFAPFLSIDELLKTGMAPRMSASLKSYTLSPSHPSAVNWAVQPSSLVKVFKNVRIRSMGELQNPLKMGYLKFFSKGKGRTDKTFESNMYMKRAPSPFAEGEIRLAYHGQIAKEERDLGGKQMVLKSFKHLGKGVNNRDQYLKQMEVSAIAHFLAIAYNKIKPIHCCQIEVLPVFVIEEVDETNESSGNRRFCTEHLLPTGGSEFIKFSNNTGYWDEDQLDQSLLRFTKFTYESTGGYIIVTDLQGVRKGNIYHLTDPVLLCKDILRFGNTNLGEKFMKKCINSTCSHLNENGWM